MRDLVVFLFVMAMMPTAFRRPYIGLLLFSWLAYMRPQDLCWGFARTMRLSFFGQDRPELQSDKRVCQAHAGTNRV